ncbi:MAG: glycosyltransferase family 1 protein [Deltaproteobacteria bacterium]|nr:glycosyltransferase family 1 protein [Deltaproteobacteria bacterium]MBI3386328.1 glycosyltransferase family 1 protein [Deltaproteobacteria bacterium]
MKIVVTGLIATYPLGGVSWDYIAYVAGFARLGHEVFYLEDTGNWFYDPRAQTFTDDVTYNVNYLLDAMRYAGVDLGDRWSVRSPDGVYHGASEAAVARFCQDADLLLNVSGACWLREAYRGARRTAYLDSDPCYSQAKLMAVERGTASEDVVYSVGLIRAHDCFFTFAENIARPSCRIPDCGLIWQTTRQPIVLDHWPVRFDAAAEAFTTVMSWKTDVTLPAIDGVTYGGKDVEFRKFLDLPQHTPAVIEVAVAGDAPVDDLRRRGWRVVDPRAKSGTMAAYRDYLAHSRGEWSVAKNAYVASRSGWFSTRTAAYLALGKPAVVQDTGFSAIYPTGAGLFAFSTMDEAVAALATINADYRKHCNAARALAEQEFVSDRVLTRLLANAGLG